MKLPPKIGYSAKAFGKKPGVDKYCPHCKHIYAGPHKGAVMEFNRDPTRDLAPARLGGVKLSYETCPDCLEHGHPRVGLP